MVGLISDYASSTSFFNLPMGNGQELGGNTFIGLPLSDIRNSNYSITFNNFTLSFSTDSSVYCKSIDPFLLYQPGSTNYTITGSENSQQYTVGQGSFSFNASPYTLSTCSDAQFYYFATLSNQSSLPSFIKLSGSMGSLNFYVDTTNNSDVGNYSIEMTGVLNNGQTYPTYFTIEVNSADPCSTATIVCNPNVTPGNISLTTADG